MFFIFFFLFIYFLFFFLVFVLSLFSLLHFVILFHGFEHSVLPDSEIPNSKNAVTNLNCVCILIIQSTPCCENNVMTRDR